MRNSRLAYLLAISLVPFPLAAQGFDCGKAQSKVEKMICADPELSSLDEKIAMVYGEVLKKFPDEALFKERQRLRIEARNRCIARAFRQFRLFLSGFDDVP